MSVNDFASLEKKGDDNNQNKCLFCCDKVADAVLMDCGHGGIWKNLIKECVIPAVKNYGKMEMIVLYAEK